MLRRVFLLFFTTLLLSSFSAVAWSKSISIKFRDPCTPWYIDKTKYPGVKEYSDGKRDRNSAKKRYPTSTRDTKKNRYRAIKRVPRTACGPWTTVDRTIGDFDSDNQLETGPGDPYVVREELGLAQPDRVNTRSQITHLAQLSDIHVIDEESPMRYEDIDDAGLGDDLLGGAYRPQDSLGTQVASAMVETLNRIRSPISDTKPTLAFVTGDSSDNMQQNETQWYIQALEGKEGLNPDSGDPEYDPGWFCDPADYPTDVYQGVRGNDWYEPDGSGDGPGYSDEEAENFQSTGRHVALRDFSGLLEYAQQPFNAKGLAYPWVTVFGNHDSLVQGNLPKSFLFEDQATDCAKDIDGDGSDETVQPDAKRHLLDHSEWIAEHFQSTPSDPGPVGHGFSAGAPDQGYYTKPITDNLRLIALDTVNYDGLAGGTIRDTQFNWLDQELTQANARGEQVIVIAHHSLRTMNNTDWFGYGDQHCGLIDQEGEIGVDCDTIGNESLEALFYRQGNVISYIAGHEHENNIEARQEVGGPGKFWEITTASEIDWPQQSSLIEVFDNKDGTISIFRTLVDHMAPVEPVDKSGSLDLMTLASISRELSFNDYQGRTGEDGTQDRRGDPEDRNVELLLDVSP